MGFLVLFCLTVIPYFVLVAWSAFRTHLHFRLTGRRALGFLLPLLIILIGLFVALLVVQQIFQVLDRSFTHGK